MHSDRVFEIRFDNLPAEHFCLQGLKFRVYSLFRVLFRVPAVFDCGFGGP